MRRAEYRNKPLVTMILFDKTLGNERFQEVAHETSARCCRSAFRPGRMRCGRHGKRSIRLWIPAADQLAGDIAIGARPDAGPADACRDGELCRSAWQRLRVVRGLPRRRKDRIKLEP